MSARSEVRASLPSTPAQIIKEFLLSKKDPNLEIEKRIGDWLIVDKASHTKALSFQFFSDDILGDRTRDRLSFDPDRVPLLILVLM